MNSWQKAWTCLKKSSKRRRKKKIRRENHRANRRAGKALSDMVIRLNSREVI
jgi:hypothetical protein